MLKMIYFAISDLENPEELRRENVFPAGICGPILY
jgi:hypothetical protein